MVRNLDLYFTPLGSHGGFQQGSAMVKFVFRKISLAAVRGETIGGRPSDEALGFQYPFVWSKVGQSTEQTYPPISHRGCVSRFRVSCYTELFFLECVPRATPLDPPWKEGLLQMQDAHVCKKVQHPCPSNRQQSSAQELGQAASNSISKSHNSHSHQLLQKP